MRRTTKDRERDKFVDGDTNKPAVRIVKSASQKLTEDADFRLMLSYQEKILTELKIMNMYLAEFAGDKIEDAE